MDEGGGGSWTAGGKGYAPPTFSTNWFSTRGLPWVKVLHEVIVGKSAGVVRGCEV